jgi:signal transduction histidine kinase
MRGHPHNRPSAFAWRVHHSLRRQLFRSFGVAILVSLALGWGVHAMLAPGPWATWLPLLLALATLWMAAGGIAWALTRPLLELVSVTRDIGAGKLDRRMRLVPLGHRGHEVAMLARSVNTMAERIERQINDQRELLATVSHELRTPLGHLRVLIDTAREQLQQPVDREASRHGRGDELAAAQAHVFDELEREVVELDGLVDQLLVHSRLEFERLELRPLDPVALAVRALERLGEDASKLEVETEVEQLVGDPTLLGRAVANLLSNAREHGGGLDRLRVTDGARGQLCFVVEDRGPGFAEAERETVFESFVQGQAHAGGSLGLGLSLVQRIAVAHGGRAWADNRETGGARVGFCVNVESSTQT